MKCQVCGKEISDEAKFCPYCGAARKDEKDQDRNVDSGIQQKEMKSVNQTSKKKKKIIAVIGIIFLLDLGIVAAAILVRHGKNSTENNKSKYLVDHSSNHSTEKETNKTTEQTTQLIETTQKDSEPYKKGYLELVKSLKSQIEAYNWQNDSSVSESYEKPKKEQTPIALTDITGDGNPELLVMYVPDKAQQESEGSDGANLDIYTSDENGSIKRIFTGEWGMRVDDEITYPYFLFKVQGSDKLYGYFAATDSENVNAESYLRFDMESGMLKAEEIAGAEIYMSASQNDSNFYGENKKTLSEKEYNKIQNELFENASELVMYNDLAKGKITKIKARAVAKYMTYDEAIGELSITEKLDNGMFPITDQLTMNFASGAGAWSTSLKLNPDGTFTGEYQDTDNMSDEGYDAEVRICSFSGKFKNIKKENEYTYSMELDNYTMDKAEGTEWIENNIKYTATGPYGIEEGKTFKLFLPGMDVSEIPEQSYSWIDRGYYLDGKTSLPFFALYNVKKGYCFIDQ